ncbi:unnamed protein product [Cyprideis torosa]|uniref:Alpha-ketoglutarate-dependent dioxygenase AlkB-like domain-containing protein n=1 Tax=Cyprideis torosa TaxID=163714 RepID=A0A7R8WFL2_9CRUS|nr:unnamed protein product [Cyprideis torosa]CAG0891992.1 unnamed protein product [Cyprideis torosa]
MEEVEKVFKRSRYQWDHWDDAIHGFRETERSEWKNQESRAVIERIRRVAFGDQEKRIMSHTHILDISEEGWIKAHVDSVRFCGSTIAGLSLCSSSVMRLRPSPTTDENNSVHVDVKLPRRSLYVMKDRVRYDYSHEVLKVSESRWNQELVPRGRRVSIICRNEPL